MYINFIKPIVDIVLSLVLLTVLFPLFIVIALCIKSDKGPVFFTQVRSGLYGKPFVILKFRTLKDGIQPLNFSNDQITRVGYVLRKFSLDELPQLINVIKGEMSLIGPRPLPEVYLERLTASQKKRLLVKPGMTGLAQVKARNGSWDNKFKFDSQYLMKLGFFIDLRIFIYTLGAFIRPSASIATNSLELKQQVERTA